MESIAGDDDILETLFEGNTAGNGGALRIGGETDLTNCTFIDNISDEDSGAAISNIGVLKIEGTSSLFSGNSFKCKTGFYLDTYGGDRYEKVCDGCPICDECEIEEGSTVPICIPQLDHTSSEGNDITVEALEIDSGYWRATPTSLSILECYNEDACNGGITGESSFCSPGYEGPYCSKCINGYSTTLYLTCEECIRTELGIVLMIVLSVVISIIYFCLQNISYSER